MKSKETKEQRLERIRLASTTQTRVIKDKKKYSRKAKHKKGSHNQEPYLFF
jgi:hypothetical protein